MQWYSLILSALFPVPFPSLCSSAAFTTTDPAQAGNVTADVANVWQAFDDAAKQRAAARAGVYAR